MDLRYAYTGMSVVVEKERSILNRERALFNTPTICPVSLDRFSN
jgi:hypothetical protein